MHPASSVIFFTTASGAGYGLLFLLGLAGAGGLVPGGRGFARLHVEGPPLALLPGDRFVVRGFSRTGTLGGGRVLDVAPPRRRRSDPSLAADLEVLAGADAVAALELRVRRAGLAGLQRDALAQQTGADLGMLAPRLGGDAPLQEPTAGVLIATAGVGEVASRLEAALADYHAREPLQPGMPGASLAGPLPANLAAGGFELALARLEEAGRLRRDGARIALADFAPRLSQGDEARAAMALARRGAAELGCAPGELGDLLAFLEREGSLVRVGELWFDRVAVDELHARVVAHLDGHGEIDTPAYKVLIGAPRKFAIPLMEHFDARHLTTRRGDVRLLDPRARPRPKGGDA